jgi:hypothetical protein
MWFFGETINTDTRPVLDNGVAGKFPAMIDKGIHARRCSDVNALARMRASMRMLASSLTIARALR